MKTISQLFQPCSFTLFASLLLSGPFSIWANPDPGGELLVKCEGGPSGELARTADAVVGATMVRRFEAIGWHLVRLPEGLGVREGMARYRVQPGVLKVEPNRQISMPPLPLPPKETGPEEDRMIGKQSVNPEAIVPNDPRYRSQWNLKKIGMEQAWAITTGSTKVVVAVMDTGVNYLHPDLAANMWRNPGETGLDAQGRDKATNGVDDDGNGYVDDVFGIDVQNHTGDPVDIGVTGPGAPNPNPHGTKCAGVIGAVGNNNTGAVGINWQVRILAVKFVAGDQQERFTSDTSGFVESLEYLIQMKRRGVNLRVVSLSASDDTVSEAVADAVRASGAEGIFCVFSAANGGLNLDTAQMDTHGRRFVQYPHRRW